MVQKDDIALIRATLKWTRDIGRLYYRGGLMDLYHKAKLSLEALERLEKEEKDDKP